MVMNNYDHSVMKVIIDGEEKPEIIASILVETMAKAGTTIDGLSKAMNMVTEGVMDVGISHPELERIIRGLSTRRQRRERRRQANSERMQAFYAPLVENMRRRTT